MRTFTLLFALFCLGECNIALSQDSVYIKVHFLYGSKPKKKYKDVEPKWFGGILGGHVGIETDSNTVLNFVPSGEFHVFAKNKERHSAFAVHTPKSFWQIFGSSTDSVKKTTIEIPITRLQKQKLDSVSKAYRSQTPYDYAFFGMRCGAAAYDILSKLGILKKYSYRKTYRKIFYPRKLRKRLIKKAKKNKWTIRMTEGTKKRKWEGD
jgi:hypothetical protein